MLDIKSLKERIKKFDPDIEKDEPKLKDTTISKFNPFRVSIDMFAGLAVGCVMGWYLDKWCSTKPIFLIIFAILGVAAGFYNIYKAATLMSGDDSSKGR